jgi:hypothetical protein
MIFVYDKVKKRKLSEKESIFWMLGAVTILILSIFPNIIIELANLLHIDYAPSLLFLLGIVFVFLLVFRLTIYVSTLKEQVKELAQRNAILESRITQLEKLKGKGNC